MWSKFALVPFAALITGSCSQADEIDKACTPPLATWGKPHPHLGPGPPIFTVSLDHKGAYYFEGKALNFGQLSSELQKIGALENPEPGIVLETEMGAPCDGLNRVRSLMNERLACEKDGHCDEGAQTIWDALPYTGAGIP